MSKWEYKVVFVEGWERISVEGQETRAEEGERNSAFGRRFLNGLGADGWELSGVQHAQPGRRWCRCRARATEPRTENLEPRAARQPFNLAKTNNEEPGVTQRQ
jgi:hypothetical protein